jgi:hypothetical protein
MELRKKETMLRAHLALRENNSGFSLFLALEVLTMVRDLHAEEDARQETSKQQAASVDISTDYTALYPRRYNSSILSLRSSHRLL